MATVIPLRNYGISADDAKDIWSVVKNIGPSLVAATAKRDKGIYSGDMAKYPVTAVFLRDFDAAQSSRGTYNDACLVYHAGQLLKIYHANTNPQPLWRARVAEVKAPQALLHIPGMHGVSGMFPHMAWRQHSTVQVMRDPAVKGGPKIPDIDSLGAKFYIDVHKGGLTSTNSLGCLTIAQSEWADFYKLTLDRTKAVGQFALLSIVLELGK